MNRAFGFVVLIVGIAALAGAGLWLSAERDDGPAGGASPAYVLPVTLGNIERGDVQPSIALTGTVRTAQWAQLAFTVDGPLQTLDVREADAVLAGDVIARIDDTDQRLAVSRAEANLSVARRQLDLLDAGERPEVTRRLAAELLAAEAEEQLANLEVARREDLVAIDDVSQAEMDRVLATQLAAAARRAAAAERLGQAESGARSEDVAIAEARASVATAVLAEARRELEKTVLKAPWPGSIVRRHVSVGDHVQPGEVVVELADLAHIEIHIEVPSRYALRLGDHPPVVVRVDEEPRFVHHTHLDAEVPAADRVSRNFRALIRLDTSDLPYDILRPGMFVRLELLLEPLRDVLTVPDDALRVTEGGPVVVVATPGEGDGLSGRWTPVRVLGSDGARTAVEPLGIAFEAGEQVVVTGVDLAYPDVALLQRSDRDASPGDGGEGTP